MVISKSYRFRFTPRVDQLQQLLVDMGCARFVWNESLTMRGKAYQRRQESLTGVDLSRRITQFKQGPYPWLADANSTVLTQTLRDQDRAFKNFFEGRARYPRYKRKHGPQSIRYQLDQRQITRTFNAEDGVLKLPKIGALKVRWSRKPEGVPKMVTVSHDACGRWFVSFSCDVDIKPLPLATGAIGIDFGIKDVVVTSDEFKSGNPKPIYKWQRRLAKAQRRLSRKPNKRTRRYRRQKLRVARLHGRVANARKDFLHKLSTKLVNENQVISVQTHNLRGMSANHHIARAIRDTGIGELTGQLQYKAHWYGRTLVEVDRWQRTTGVCPACGLIGPKLALSVRQWRCECGQAHDRDVASAKVIALVGRGIAPELMRAEGGRSRLAAAG